MSQAPLPAPAGSVTFKAQPGNSRVGRRRTAQSHRVEHVNFDGTSPLIRIAQHFCGQPFHERSATVDWEFEDVLKELRPHLFHSSIHHDWKHAVASKTFYVHLVFHLPDDCFVRLYQKGGQQVEVYAACPETAEAVLTSLNQRFAKPPPETSRFYQLCSLASGIERLEVALSRVWLQSPADLALHYGDEFVGWEQNLVERLQTQPNGLTILRGEPGLGKTSFVRHLLSRLQQTHRCFAVPTSHFGMLTSPHLTTFWAKENARSKLNNLLVLEDAEALLEKRRGGNSELVSNLLNLADGLLGDAMRVQIIATVNSPINKLDPAITRRGRLQAYHQFRRLTRCEAQRLALAKGFTLREQPDYTLADIFTAAKADTGVPQETTIGFR